MFHIFACLKPSFTSFKRIFPNTLKISCLIYWEPSFFRLSSLTHYYVPKDGPLSSYKEYITMLPPADNPEAFGQHSNADIASQIQETRLLFDTLLSLQPQVATGVGESKEDKVKLQKKQTVYVVKSKALEQPLWMVWCLKNSSTSFLWCFTRTVSWIINLPIKSRQRVISYNYGFDWQVLESSSNIYKTLPENIDYENTKKILSVDPSPLNVVLLQEIERYNALLNMIRKQLIDLERGIQGLVVMSTELEEIFSCIYNGQVPPPWEKVSVYLVF